MVNAKNRIIVLCFLLVISLLPGKSAANVRLPALVGDYMILQRDTKVPIWGWADAGEKVILSFQNKTYNAKPDENGKFMLTLPAMPAGGPYQMIISGSNTITIKYILIGDVWLASGQSNMAFPLSGANQSQQEITRARFPQIRLIEVKREISVSPQSKFESEGWKECHPQNAGKFSAVAYFFASNIHQHYKVPIGIISSSWGGTPAEAWTSGTALKKLSDYKPVIEAMESGLISIEKQKKQYEADLIAWENLVQQKDRGLIGNKPWYATDINTIEWPTMAIPNLWKEAGLPNYEGIVWLRKEVMVPDAQAGQEMKLFLARIDDIDSTWFNGVPVGYTIGRNKVRKYTVPASLVKAGRNVLTIRVTDIGNGGGIMGQSNELRLASATASIPLAGLWSYQIAIEPGDLPKYPRLYNSNHTPSGLYNAMIAPLVPYAIKGVIWYQGEGNVRKAHQYRTLFPALIQDWRNQWHQEFSFLFVQLANFQQVTTEPGESELAELREAQSMALASPKTGMAVIMDIGEADDIHPKNKQDVGGRLAKVAQKIAYGEEIIHSGPLYTGMKAEGDKIRLLFRYAGGGLVAKGGPLKQFAIAGPDKKFVWADARIEGNTIVVWNSAIKTPAAVRYAWANNPQGANLYNKEGLLASPFRTDNWPGRTVGRK